MKAPRYAIGDRVFYVSQNPYAKVLCVINAGDSQDISAQGFRYEVQCAGWIWSVPESSLRVVAAQK